MEGLSPQIFDSSPAPPLSSALHSGLRINLRKDENARKTNLDSSNTTTATSPPPQMRGKNVRLSSRQSARLMVSKQKERQKVQPLPRGGKAVLEALNPFEILNEHEHEDILSPSATAAAAAAATTPSPRTVGGFDYYEYGSDEVGSVERGISTNNNHGRGRDSAEKPVAPLNPKDVRKLRGELLLHEMEGFASMLSAEFMGGGSGVEGLLQHQKKSIHSHNNNSSSGVGSPQTTAAASVRPSTALISDHIYNVQRRIDNKLSSLTAAQQQQSSSTAFGGGASGSNNENKNVDDAVTIGGGASSSVSPRRSHHMRQQQGDGTNNMAMDSTSGISARMRNRNTTRAQRQQALLKQHQQELFAPSSSSPSPSPSPLSIPSPRSAAGGGVGGVVGPTSVNIRKGYTALAPNAIPHAGTYSASASAELAGQRLPFIAPSSASVTTMSLHTAKSGGGEGGGRGGTEEGASLCGGDDEGTLTFSSCLTPRASGRLLMQASATLHAVGAMPLMGKSETNPTLNRLKEQYLNGGVGISATQPPHSKSGPPPHAPSSARGLAHDRNQQKPLPASLSARVVANSSAAQYGLVETPLVVNHFTVTSKTLPTLDYDMDGNSKPISRRKAMYDANGGGKLVSGAQFKGNTRKIAASVRRMQEQAHLGPFGLLPKDAMHEGDFEDDYADEDVFVDHQPGGEGGTTSNTPSNKRSGGRILGLDEKQLRQTFKQQTVHKQHAREKGRRKAADDPTIESDQKPVLIPKPPPPTQPTDCASLSTQPSPLSAAPPAERTVSLSSGPIAAASEPQRRPSIITPIQQQHSAVNATHHAGSSDDIGHPLSNIPFEESCGTGPSTPLTTQIPQTNATTTSMARPPSSSNPLLLSSSSQAGNSFQRPIGGGIRGSVSAMPPHRNSSQRQSLHLGSRASFLSNSNSLSLSHANNSDQALLAAANDQQRTALASVTAAQQALLEDLTIQFNEEIGNTNKDALVPLSPAVEAAILGILPPPPDAHTAATLNSDWEIVSDQIRSILMASKRQSLSFSDVVATAQNPQQQQQQQRGGGGGGSEALLPDHTLAMQLRERHAEALLEGLRIKRAVNGQIWSLREAPTSLAQQRIANSPLSLSGSAFSRLHPGPSLKSPTTSLQANGSSAAEEDGSKSGPLSQNSKE